MPSPINLTTDSSEYHYVALGPIPDLPDWHEQGVPVRYPFPTVEAATRFAQERKRANPRREVAIVYPDGRRWDGKRFVA